MSQTSVEHRRSALQHGEVVGGGAGAASEDGHDDAEADDDFGGGDHEHEEHDDLAADVVELRAKVTNVRLTALSISSTHMNITSGLRRTSSPTAPIVNSSAAERRGTRYVASTSSRTVDAPSRVGRRDGVGVAAAGRSTTAPTTAITSSTDVTSKANR